MAEDEIADDYDLNQYLKLCKRIYERMDRENSWPWVVDPEGWRKEHGKILDDETAE